MSDHFNKDYGDYFKILEQKLEKESRNEYKTQNNTPRTVAVKSRPAKKGIYGVFRLRKSVIAVLLVAVLVALTAIIVPKANGSDKETDKDPKVKSAPVEDKQTKVEKPAFKEAEIVAEIPATNDAKNAVIIDLQTDTVIAAKNPHERAYPASTTKIMTLIVANELITDYTETFTMTYEITDPLYIAEASVAGFLNNESVNMTDLLYGMILPSGADAAMALAIHLAGSEEAFVKLMNQKVEELGLENTHFDNVTGLHSENNYSSVYDMAIILNEAIKDELCKEILSTYQYTTAKTEQNPNGIPLSSTLFSLMYGTEPETATILGGKTGFVNESGYCIASYGSNNENGNEYIVVTFGNSAKYPAALGQIDLYKEFAK